MKDLVNYWGFFVLFGSGVIAGVSADFRLGTNFRLIPLIVLNLNNVFCNILLGNFWTAGFVFLSAVLITYLYLLEVVLDEEIAELEAKRDAIMERFKRSIMGGME